MEVIYRDTQKPVTTFSKADAGGDLLQEILLTASLFMTLTLDSNAGYASLEGVMLGTSCVSLTCH